MRMADPKNQLAADGPTSVSALGLRWAALRGMLGSPLIEADEQKSLRDELLRELQVIERDFAVIASRNAVEVTAKIDVVKTVLRQNGFDQDGWIESLLDSVQSDVRSLGQTSQRSERSPVNLTRTTPTRGELPSSVEADQPAVA